MTWKASSPSAWLIARTPGCDGSKSRTGTIRKRKAGQIYLTGHGSAQRTRQSGGELLHGSADDARERGCGSRAADRVVQTCGHRVEPDAAELAERYGAETTVPEWRE